MLNFRSGLYKIRPTISQMVQADPTTLDGMNLPTAVQLSDFKAAVMANFGGLETLFLTAAELKAYLPVWSAWQLPQWNRITNALEAEYEPLENYNMHEVESPAEYTETLTPAETTDTIRPAETTDTETPAETTKTLTPAETTTTIRPAEVTETEIRQKWRRE